MESSFLNSTDSIENKKSVNELFSSAEIRLSIEDICKNKTNCTELNKTTSVIENSLDDFELLDCLNLGEIQVKEFDKEKLTQLYTFSKAVCSNNDIKPFQAECKTIGSFVGKCDIISFHYYNGRQVGFIFIKGREITVAYCSIQNFSGVIADLLVMLVPLEFLTQSKRVNYYSFCDSWKSFLYALEKHAEKQKSEIIVDFELSGGMSILDFPAGISALINNTVSAKLFIDATSSSKSDAFLKAVTKLALRRNSKGNMFNHKINTQELLFNNEDSAKDILKVHITIEDPGFTKQQGNLSFDDISFNVGDKESIESNITRDNNLSNKNLEHEANDSKLEPGGAQQTINTYNEDGFTLLHLAAQKGDLEEGRRLIQFKVDIEITSKTKGGRDTALHLAAQKGHSNFVELLLDSGADVNKVSATGSEVTPLHEAAYYGHVDVIKLLISYNATIDAKDRNGYSPLQYACSNGKLSSVQLLLKEGANPYLQNNNGETALFDAVCFGYLEIVSALISTSVNKENYINMQNGYGKTVLHAVACKPKISKTHKKAIELLLKNGADPRLKDKLGQSPSDIAKKYNNKELISLLVPQSIKKSESPIVAASMLVAVGVSLGVAVSIYLEVLAVGITAVGVCLLLSAAIVFSYYYSSQAMPKSSLKTASNISCLKSNNICQNFFYKEEYFL